ncbi:MAG: T9SS type A sorting domain-containing protein [Chitinophagales bacterium]|nr:T9SS type A sorting domain-containing protein [Chitinophagales bacterium]
MKNIFTLLFLLLVGNIHAQQYGQFQFENRVRNYIVYLPKNFSPNENLPLVINMHGFTQNGGFQMNYTKYNALADTARCIVVYPNGIDARWNSGTFFFIESDVNDVGFLSELIDRMHLLYNINLEKVYATGYSAGGFMSYKLACDATNRFAAIAPLVASMIYDNIETCVPARAFPLIACNGSADPITPYNGIPLNFPGIDSIKSFWQITNNCNNNVIIDTLPNTNTTDGSRAVRYTYTDCNDNVTTSFYKMISGGHTWAGADNVFLGILGKTNQDISWTKESWNFFQQNKIPSSVQCSQPIIVDVEKNINNYTINWTLIENVDNYRIAIIDSSDNITFLESTSNSVDITLDTNNSYKFAVASICSSGFVNWSTIYDEQAVVSSIKNKTTLPFSIYPNPTQQFIQLDIPTNKLLNYTIYNSVGNLVMSANYNAVPINIQKLSNGYYIVNVYDGTTNYVSRFTKF